MPMNEETQLAPPWWRQFVEPEALVLIAAAPALIVPGIFGDAAGPAIAWFSLVAVALAAAMVFSRSAALAIAMTLVGVFALAGWLRAEHRTDALPHLTGLAFGLLAMAATARWCRAEPRLRLAMSLLTVAALAMLSVGVISMGAQKSKILAPEMLAPLPQIRLDPPGREAAFEVNPNALGGTALMLLPLTLAMVRLPLSRPWHRVLAGMGFVAAAGAVAVIVITQSRSAWGGVWLTLLVVAVFRQWQSWKRWTAVALLVLVPLAGVVTLRFVSRPDYDRLVGLTRLSVERRVPVWRKGVELLKRQPVLGIGLNEFRHYDNPGRRDIAHAHNFFLQTALDIGLAGLAAYLALVGVVLARAVKGSRGTGMARYVAAGAGLTLVAVHAFGLGDSVSLGAKVGVMQWLAAGLVLAVATPPRRIDDRPGVAPAETGAP